jgi:hypothetical protein
MTSEELADILAKAAAVPTTKATFDAAQAAHTIVLNSATAAKAAWLAAVDSSSDEPTLTSLANQCVATAVAEAEALTILQASGGPWQVATAALEAALQAVISEALNP